MEHRLSGEEEKGGRGGWGLAQLRLPQPLFSQAGVICMALVFLLTLSLQSHLPPPLSQTLSLGVK